MLPFASWRELPKSNGLYSIWDEVVDSCVYVGQGSGSTGIRGRFNHHYNKAYSVEAKGTSHSRAWVHHRQHTSWDPSQWRIEYFECKSAVHRTYLEGAMMLLFNPKLNDECFEDCVRTLGL
jgi:hypothetical protein